MPASDPWDKTRAFALLGIATAIISITPRLAADPPTLSGSWSATSMRSQWNIGDWGKACGPPPSGGGAPAGPVTVSQSGAELSFKGAGRNFTTAECWEQFPGLTRISHSGGARNWKNVCKTPPGDPRQATLVTSISATDKIISFDETGQYQFVINGQNCTASVRRTRTYSLVLREGETPAEPATTPAPVPAPAPELPAPAAEPAKPKKCESPGEPQRLEVRPLRKLMRPGESFTFRAAVVDAKGCALPLVPSWQVVGTTKGVRMVAPAKIEVEITAPESEAILQASFGDRSARVFVEVASRERYDALLAERGLNQEGESSDAAIARIASESIGGRSAVARDAAQGRKRLFVAIVGGAALLLGIAGFVMVRRGRARQNETDDATSLDQPPTTRRAASARICPTCREEYPEDAVFCPLDGNRLVLTSGKDSQGPSGGVCPVCGHGYDPGISVCPKHQEELVPVAVYMAGRTQAAPIARKICPVCGAQFTGESEFCGRCGAALVPVN